MLYSFSNVLMIFSMHIHMHTHIGHSFNNIYDKGSVTYTVEIKHVPVTFKLLLS